MEKILEKSGESQGILSARKSGNPVNVYSNICYTLKFTNGY